MVKNFWVLFVVLTLAFSCQKQVKVEEQPGALAPVPGNEPIKQYLAVNRPPVSASFNIFSLKGSFKGELYLAPGETTLSLVYGYMPLGKSLFEFKLEGRNFIYLDLSNSYAYSNRKDWLKDFVVDTWLDDQDQMALMLIQSLQALAGDLPAPVRIIKSGEKQVVGIWSSGPDHEIKYFFSPDLTRLSKMEIKKQNSAMVAEFEYSDTLWFPESIRFNSEKISALVKMEKITCPENNRPQINFEIPDGFVNILLTGR